MIRISDHIRREVISLFPSDEERVGLRGFGNWALVFSIFAASSRRDDD
jgi:hypothetical protein